jgi:glutathione peroxidase
MKLLFILAIFMFGMNQQTSFYDFKVKGLDGKEIEMSAFKGKKILIVNTASECGYTPQYEGLEQLYEKYKDRLVVIAFPANNFGEQEPGSNEQIREFCTEKYKVSFPIMGKVSVKGDDMDPLFKYLTSLPNPDFTGDIKWNFEKFLIDENGTLLRRFRSKTTPMSEELISAIEK